MLKGGSKNGKQKIRSLTDRWIQRSSKHFPSVNYDDILWIFILTSSGQFQTVSDGKRFRSKCISYAGTPSWFDSEEYKDFEKKKYFELVSQGWRPISGAHELEFTRQLYRESSDPQDKSLDELETMLRRMLLLKDQDAQKVFIQLGGSQYFIKKMP